MKVLCCFILPLLLSGPLSSEEAMATEQAPETNYQRVRSPGGFLAHYLRFQGKDGDFVGRTMIEKEGLVVGVVEGARPVSFSPTADILLVVEDFADDDLRHYLLKIGDGQFSRKDERANYVFGSRFVAKAEWSNDGKFLTLTDHPGITDNASETIKVAGKLGK
jgi:hypothetical protein